MAYSTEKGRNWLLKALDPSMTSVDVDGIPDMSVDNVIMLKYNSQFQVSAPASIQANQTWNADIYLFPHPVLFGTCLKYNSSYNIYDKVSHKVADYVVGQTTYHQYFELDSNTVFDSSSATTGEVNFVERQNFLNTQVKADHVVGMTNSDFILKSADLSKNVDGVRIAFGSVTLIPNVSSLYDSGVLVATQQATHKTYSDLNPTSIAPPTQDASQNYSGGNGAVFPLNTDVSQICEFDENDFPTFENAVNNPQMLSTRFKNGIYMPYKIMNAQTSSFRKKKKKTYFATKPILEKCTFVKQSTDTSTKKCLSVTYAPIIDQGGANLYNKFTNPLTGDIVTQNFQNVSTGKVKISDLSYGDMANNNNWGIDLCGDNIMCISIRGLAQQATFSLVFRLGFECRVAAGTNYSMFKYVSPNYDEAALRSYQNVVRQSKDAYVGDLEGSPRLRQALSALIGIEPSEETGDMPSFVGSIGV